MKNKSAVEKFSRNLVTQKGRSTSYVVDEIVLKNGSLAIRDYLAHPGAVGILAKYEGKFIFVRQYRYPVKKETYEIPAGKLDKNEDLEVCAKRELVEETGFIAKKLIHLVSYHPTVAFSNEIIHLFYADDLTESKACPDSDEEIKTVRLTERALSEMVKKGRIRDSKTLIAYMYYRIYTHMQ